MRYKQPKLDHLYRMTDNFGILEHAVISVPNLKEGYCVDDNARSLMVALKYNKSELVDIYLKFLNLSFVENGFRNDVTQDMIWDNVSNKENFGRAMAALAETSVLAEQESQRLTGAFLFDQLSYLIKGTESNRAKAWIIYALYKRKGVKENINEKIKKYFELKMSQGKVNKNITIDLDGVGVKLANDILTDYEEKKEHKWRWFEENITYDNGRIPWGLFYAYKASNDDKYLEVAIESLDFLTEKIFDLEKGYFSFPGYRGWLNRTGFKAEFGQQPIEAGSMVEVYVLAYKITKNKKYKELAIAAFRWFFGKNILGVNMIDDETGGVFDGLEKEGVNLNQGAEALLSYLIAAKDLKEIL